MIKHILFLSLFLPLSVCAQGFKLALRGSGLYTSGNSGNELAIASRKAPGFAGSMLLGHGGPHFEVAYGLEIGKLAGEQISIGAMPVNITGIQNIARTYYLQHVVASYKIPADKFHPYAGIMAGFILTDGTAKLDLNPYISSGNPFSLQAFKTRGAVAGIHAGAGWPFAPQFQLVGELGLRHAWLRESAKSLFDDSPKFSYSLLSAHFTIGISYTP